MDEYENDLMQIMSTFVPTYLICCDNCPSKAVVDGRTVSPLNAAVTLHDMGWKYVGGYLVCNNCVPYISKLMWIVAPTIARSVTV